MPSSAFTLIELLVVITIIAVLASLLLPAIGLVRDQAKTAACISSLSGNGQAILLSATDNDGLLPWGRTPSWSLWPTALADLESNLRFTCANAPVKAGALHYTANIQVLTDRQFGGAKTTLRQVSTSEVRSNLVMLFDGGQVNLPGDSYHGRARELSHNMGFTFYYSDNPYLSPANLNSAPSATQTSGAFRVDNRHGSGKRANYLFADGHVQTLMPKDLLCGDFRIRSNGRKYW